MLMVQSRLSFLRTAPVCKIPLIGQPLPPGHFGFFGALRGDARPLRVCRAGSVVTQRLWLRPCPCAGPVEVLAPVRLLFAASGCV